MKGQPCSKLYFLRGVVGIDSHEHIGFGGELMWARMTSLHTEPAQESLISGSWWLLKCYHSPIYYIHIARWRDSDIPQIDDKWIDQHLDSTGRYWKQNIKSLSFAEGLDGLDLHIGLFIQTFPHVT